MAENITVTLVLDDSQYKGKLVSAGADATLFGTKVAQASQSTQGHFDKLTSGADKLRNTMLGLSTALLGAGIVAFGHSALALANDISDLSKGTDISIARILQLQQAFATSGGSAEGLGQVIQKLNNYLQDARDGSQVAQESLLKLGLSFSDIANLDTDQAMQRIINQFALMTDPIERNALAVKIFGKEAKNIDWAGVAAGTTTTAAEFYKLQESIKKGEEVSQKLEQATKKLQLAFLELIDQTGILDFLNNTNDSFSKFEAIVRAAGIAFATYFAVTVFIEAAKAITILGEAIVGLGVAFKIIESTTVVGRLVNIGLAIAALTAGWFGYKHIVDIINGTEVKPQIAPVDQGKFKPGSDTFVGPPRPQAQAAAVEPYWVKEVKGIQQISVEYEKANQKIVDRINFQTKLIGKTQEQMSVEEAAQAFEERYLNQISDLDKKILAETAAMNDSNREGQLAKIRALGQEKIAIEDSHDADKAKAVDAAANNAAQKKALQEVIKLYDQQVERQRRISEAEDQFNKAFLTTTEQKYYDIATAARKRAEDEIIAQEKLTEIIGVGADGQAIYAGITLEAKQKIIDKYSEEAQALVKLEQNTERVTKDFSVSWGKAFRSYVEAANDAGAAALRLFDKTMSGMEDLIVNFVKTGKFQWKDFVASMAEEVLRSNVKQLLASLFNPGSATSAAGPLGGFGKLLGALVGGNKRDGSSAGSALYVIPADIAGIAGSAIGGQSGGFMDTLKGIFGGVSDAVSSIFGGSAPSTASGGGIGGGFLGDVISSIGDFFGGFFADGGSLGAGKFGVAGEHGPELIRGPASVTPMMGGGNVTYNINAVDAMSFKALIAQDPGFIHAVAQQGALGIAGRR